MSLWRFCASVQFFSRRRAPRFSSATRGTRRPVGGPGGGECGGVGGGLRVHYAPGWTVRFSGSRTELPSRVALDPGQHPGWSRGARGRAGGGLGPDGYRGRCARGGGCRWSERRGDPGGLPQTYDCRRHRREGSTGLSEHLCCYGCRGREAVAGRIMISSKSTQRQQTCEKRTKEEKLQHFWEKKLPSCYFRFLANVDFLHCS